MRWKEISTRRRAGIKNRLLHRLRIIQRDHKISEAPVGNYDAIGVHDEGSFIHQQDRDIIGSPKAEVKIRRMLSRVPQTIDIAFLDTGFRAKDNDDLNQYWNEIAGPRKYADISSIVKDLPPRSDTNSITLILTNNEGNKRIQLSGWVVAHRLGHALAFSSDFEDRFQNIYHTVRDLQSYWGDGWVIPSLEVYYAIGKMKSCRDRNLTQNGEFVFELFAQYIVQGSVSFNRMDRASADYMIVRTQKDWGFASKVTDEDLERFNEMLPGAERTINSICASILKAAEGLAVVL